MRSYIDVDKAKQALLNKKDKSGIYQLPPGFFAGFKLVVTDDNQLTVTKGICNIRGKRVENTTTYIIDGEDFIAPDYILTTSTYYVYINSGGQFRVDSVDATYDEDDFGYYHPTLHDHRYLGQFKIHTDGTYYDVLQQDPVVKGGISAEAVEAMFLYALNAAIIGYSRTDTSGINESPSEGDRRVYIDEDEIGLEEYTGGAWSTVNGIKIGNAIAGLFLAMIGCTGLYHPNNPPTATEVFPTNDFRLFDFEGDYEDHLGVDDWDSKSNQAISTSQKKFGSYSLFATANSGSYLRLNNGWTFGESQSFGAYACVTAIGSSYGLVIADYRDATLDNALRIIIYETYIQFYCRKGGTLTTSNYIIDPEDSLWHYYALSYDKDTNTIYGVVDNSIVVEFNPDGTWDSGTARMDIAAANNYQTELTVYVDDVIFAPNIFVDPDIWIQHYNHGVAWNTDYAWSDILIQPNTNGRVYIPAPIKCTDASEFDDDLTVGGQITIDGASRVRATQDSSQLITNGTNVQMTFNNEDWDNLGEFASSTFTAIEAGYYKISAGFAFTSTAWVAGNLIIFSVYINAVAKTVLYDQRIQANITNVISGRGLDIVYLNAGDTLYVNLYISRTAGNASLLNNTTYNYLNIHRLS